MPERVVTRTDVVDCFNSSHDSKVVLCYIILLAVNHKLYNTANRSIKTSTAGHVVE